LGWGGSSNGDVQTLGNRTFKLSGGQWNVVVQQQQDQGQDQKQQAVSSSRVSSIINSANTTSWQSLSSAERSAVQNYLTSNTSALTDKNFSTFTPGSVLSWALGMGTSTSLNVAAKSLGFTTYENGQFSKNQPHRKSKLLLKL